MWILLACLAFVGVLIIGLSCYLITFLVYLFTLRFTKLSLYHQKIAIALDKLGNVLIGMEANFLLIKHDSKDEFGDGAESISDNLGDNKKTNELSEIGKGIADALDKIDPNHVEKASDNNN